MKNVRRIATGIGVVAAGGFLVGCGQGEEAASGEVALLEYLAAVPAEWQARPPSNEMRLVEYTVPVQDGEEPAEVVVYYFGEGQGGDVQANIDRWTSQFSMEDGGPIMPSVAELDGAPFRTVIADFEGSYGRGVGMGPDREEARPGQALTAAVIATPRGNLFVQLFGPVASVRAARSDFIDFVSTIH